MLKLIWLLATLLGTRDNYAQQITSLIIQRKTDKLESVTSELHDVSYYRGI